MATHSSTLAWKIPWTEEPSRLQSMGSWRVGQDWATSLSLFTFMHWRRKWQPTPVFLPGESQGQGSLVGCRLWGHTELVEFLNFNQSVTKWPCHYYMPPCKRNHDSENFSLLWNSDLCISNINITPLSLTCAVTKRFFYFSVMVQAFLILGGVVERQKNDA